MKLLPLFLLVSTVLSAQDYKKEVLGLVGKVESVSLIFSKNNKCDTKWVYDYSLNSQGLIVVQKIIPNPN